MNPMAWWLWAVAAGVFVWCGLLAFAEALVRTFA